MKGCHYRLATLADMNDIKAKDEVCVVNQLYGIDALLQEELLL